MYVYITGFGEKVCITVVAVFATTRSQSIARSMQSCVSHAVMPQTCGAMWMHLLCNISSSSSSSWLSLRRLQQQQNRRHSMAEGVTGVPAYGKSSPCTRWLAVYRTVVHKTAFSVRISCIHSCATLLDSEMLLYSSGNLLCDDVPTKALMTRESTDTQAHSERCMRFCHFVCTHALYPYGCQCSLGGRTDIVSCKCDVVFKYYTVLEYSVQGACNIAVSDSQTADRVRAHVICI